MRAPLPKPIPLPPEWQERILYKDEQVLLLNKPAGLTVHAGPRGGASLEDWLPALMFGLRRLPQPGHRLDTDTAGCLVLGRTRQALARLGECFSEGLARKTYWAVVRGAPPQPEGLVEAPLSKYSTREEGWRMVVDPAGKPASTEWRVLGTGEGLSWLELRPRTGRTHQLRVHCEHLGCPILGDERYGGGAGSMHLLARHLSLPFAPPPAPLLEAIAPVPSHMQEAMSACGWQELP